MKYLALILMAAALSGCGVLGLDGEKSAFSVWTEEGTGQTFDFSGGTLGMFTLVSYPGGEKCTFRVIIGASEYREEFGVASLDRATPERCVAYEGSYTYEVEDDVMTVCRGTENCVRYR